MGLLIVAFVNIVSVLIFGTSPGLRLFGLAIIDAKGAAAGRLRLLWRSFVAWLPCFRTVVIFLLRVPRRVRQFDRVSKSPHAGHPLVPRARSPSTGRHAAFPTYGRTRVVPE